jgi:hypothetical protein
VRGGGETPGMFGRGFPAKLPSARVKPTKYLPAPIAAAYVSGRKCRTLGGSGARARARDGDVDLRARARAQEWYPPMDHKHGTLRARALFQALPRPAHV